jgi:hypothetical protein
VSVYPLLRTSYRAVAAKALSSLETLYHGSPLLATRIDDGRAIRDNAVVEPTDPVKKAEYLERLMAGLEQTRENLKFEIPYYKPDDIQGHYAKKYLASIEQHLAETAKRLEELRKTLPPSAKPKGE